MSKLLKIGAYKVDHIKEFFFDGCHKIYLIEDDNDKQDFFKMDWKQDDIYPIIQLPDKFWHSCPLRFINTCKLKQIVPQCRQRVKFTFDDKITYHRF